MTMATFLTGGSSGSAICAHLVPKASPYPSPQANKCVGEKPSKHNRRKCHQGHVGLVRQEPIARYNILLPGSLFRTDARNAPTCVVVAQERRRGLIPGGMIQIHRRTYRPNDRSGNADTLPVVKAHVQPLGFSTIRSGHPLH